jgi:hypothetical protein
VPATVRLRGMSGGVNGSGQASGQRGHRAATTEAAR